MATALVSLITGRPVRDDVAMTGEITLTGQVLPIGGLKEKALAAQRNGIGTVIAPALNEADIEDIPEHLRARSRSCSSTRSARCSRRRSSAPGPTGARGATDVAPGGYMLNEPASDAR